MEALAKTLVARPMPARTMNRSKFLVMKNSFHFYLSQIYFRFPSTYSIALVQLTHYEICSHVNVYYPPNFAGYDVVSFSARFLFVAVLFLATSLTVLVVIYYFIQQNTVENLVTSRSLPASSFHWNCTDLSDKIRTTSSSTNPLPDRSTNSNNGNRKSACSISPVQ